MRVRSGTSFLFGFIAALILIGCAGFKYRHYFVEMAAYDGKLIGNKPENDLSLELCRPSTQDARPCVVMFREEFYAMKKNYEKLQTDLAWCERQ